MKPKIFHLLLISLFISLSSFGQQKRPLRLEIPVKDDTEIYKVVPCSDNGVMVIYLSSEMAENGDMIWVAAFLDRSLMERWRKQFILPRGFILKEALYANGHMVGFWFSQKENDQQNLRIADFSVRDTAFRNSVVGLPDRSEFSAFAICNDYAVAGINTRDQQSMFLKYDLLTGLITRIDSNTGGDVVLQSLNLDQQSGDLSAILRTTGSARKRAYYFVKRDKNGLEKANLRLSRFDDNNMINTAFTYSTGPGSDIILGSYGRSNRTRVIDGHETVGVASTGFFSIVISNNTESNTSFFEFSDLQNFYRYLKRPSDLSVRRGNNRAERTKDYSLDFDLLTHTIFKWKNDYVFVAEAYYPEYRTVTTMVYDYYGRPYPSTYSVFEGFRYLTTFIAGFDSTGAMKWNNDLELRNILSQDLREKVLTWEDTDGLVLAYTNDAKVASKILTSENTASSIAYSDIEPMSPRDRVFTDSNSNIVYWYDTFFLVYGYQNIRNNYQPERNNKSIFYINKMAFR